MEKCIIWHNPKCSKSRQTLELLQQSDVELEIVEYLKAPPTDKQLHEAVALLGVKPRDIVRTKEALYKELGFSLDDDEAVVSALVENPKLIERPIVIYEGKAVIGRPPENVHEIL